MMPALAAMLVAASAAIFVVDVLMPLGAAIPLLYVALVLLSLLFRWAPLAVILGAVASLLVIGASFIPTAVDWRAESAERGLALLMIWVTAFLCFRYARVAARLGDARRELQKRADSAASRATNAERALKSEQTSHRLTEGELQHAEQRYRAIFNQTFQILAILDPAGTVREVNQTLLNAGGLRQADIAAKPIWDLPVWDRFPRSKEALRRGVETSAKGDFFRDEAVLERSGGEEITVDFSLKPVRSKLRDVDFLIFEARDTSDYRQTQESVAHQRRLEVVGRLTSGVAHDFNNLLAVIGGNIELAERRINDPSAVAARLGKALDAVFQGKELTQQLLAFARKQELTPKPVEMGALIGSVRGLLERTLPDNVSITSEVAEETWPILVDRSQLETAILHLAVNARDAMPKGGRIVLRCANHAVASPGLRGRLDLEPGDYVRIDVIDEGIGIPPAILDDITEPFFTTKGPGEGSGLGLSIAYGFIKQSGGDLQVASELERGTTVSIFLPRASDLPDAAAGQTPRTGPKPDARILLLEDDRRVREVITGILADGGYRVEEADSGEAARERLKAEAPIDLLLTDVLIPGSVTAREVADLTHTLHPQAKVLFSSANRELAKSLLSKSIEGESFIAKPYKAGELLQTIGDLLSEER